jgi:hypothetical protein
MKTKQDNLALQLLKAKQTFTFKACEMNDIREQVKIAKKNLAAAIAPSPQRRRAARPTPDLSNLQDSTPDPIEPTVKITLQEFNLMSPAHKMKFVKSGGKII